MTTSAKPRVRSLRPASFVLAQLLVLGITAAATAYRSVELARRDELPPLQPTPLNVSPEYDYPVVVSDEQLQRVLRKLAPRDLGGKTTINNTDHALRCWGVGAKFPADRYMSGEEMRRRLTDQRRFVELYGPDQPPLLVDVAGGVRVRVNEGRYSSSHVDHTLACLAEVGTPLDFPLVSPEGPTTYRAMVEQSFRDFHLNQVEYEWSILTYTLFLPPTRSWVTCEKQNVNFDMLARRLMREEMPHGVCFGNHRLYTLVVMLRIHRDMPLLSEETQAEVLRYLGDMTARLVRHQHVDGYWDEEWPNKPAKPGNRVTLEQLRDRLLATGHALEWWAIAPTELHPPRPVLAAGGQWLVNAVDAMSEEDTRELFSFLTHVSRALAWWRAKQPAEVDLGW